MPKRVGNQTFYLECEVFINSYAAVVGAKEGDGPLGTGFDKVYNDELVGEDSFEKAESRLQTMAVQTAINKSGMTEDQIDYMFAGDLLNQCIGSAYGLKDFSIPFIGLYGACSTMALSLSLASLIIASGAANNAIAVTSSHFCSAERQFRFPLEYGGQRTPTAQWTVTGSGAVLLSRGNSGPRINAITFGKINDLGVKDMNNMGAAMAPAAAETIKAYLDDTHTSPNDYDLILTGDLGKVGSELLYELLLKENISIAEKHNDCGLMIYDLERQDVHAGGSGCGCSASVLCSKILNDFKGGQYKNILFCATGALMSPTSTLQGQSIPSIAHLVNIIA